MKKLAIIVFMLVTTVARAQNITGLPEVDGKIFYQNVVAVPEKSKDFIFSAAKKWMLDTFKDRTGGLTSDDKDQGQILGRCGFIYQQQGTLFHEGFIQTYIFNVVIDCKDNKYRIQLYNMFYGDSIDDKTLRSLEDYNEDLKKTKSEKILENGYNLNYYFNAVLTSLADAINKAAKDDF